MISGFIHVAAKDIISLFYWLSNIPLYIHITFYLSIHLSQTFRLFPCLGYCKYCCYEYLGAHIFSTYSFLHEYAQSGIAVSYGNTIFIFLRNLHTVLHSGYSENIQLIPFLHTKYFYDSLGKGNNNKKPYLVTLNPRSLN